MRPLLAVPALVAALGLSGCADAEAAALRIKDCAAIAGTLTDSGIGSVPTRDQATKTSRLLRDEVKKVTAPEVGEPAAALRAAYGAAEVALRAGNAQASAAAADRARAAARALATACEVPLEQIVDPRT